MFNCQGTMALGALPQGMKRSRSEASITIRALFSAQPGEKKHAPVFGRNNAGFVRIRTARGFPVRRFFCGRSFR